MGNLKYLDKKGTFTLNNPDLTSYMYFPLANEAMHEEINALHE